MRLSILLLCVAITGCATGNDADGFGGQGANAPAAGNAPGGGSAGPAGGSAQGGGPTGGAPSVGGQGGGTTSGPAQGGVLIFSEYVEGSSNNKAVEIANIGDEAVALDDCVINRYQNGATAPLAAVLALDPTNLAPGAAYVVCNTQFTQASLCDQSTADLQHSGNDVVELVCGGQTRDVIGRVGEDAVWGTPPTSTEDATLRRLCSVTVGDTNDADSFDPASEWSGFAIDTVADLGQYVCP